MQYLMLVCSDGISTPEIAATMQEHTPAWVEEMDSSGARLLGNGLLGPDAAKSVRVRDGQTLVSDGPFAETKEFLAGIAVLNTHSEQEAIELAAKFPLARFHMVEVRPFWGG